MKKNPNSTDRDGLLQIGVQTLRLEAKTLEKAAQGLNQNFTAAIEAILNSQGRVVCTGLGKSGHIARKIASTLASTGTPALYLHPAEALHGDLGMLTESDVLLAVAYGGETLEVNDVAKFARRLGICIVAITGKLQSSLASSAVS